MSTRSSANTSRRKSSSSARTLTRRELGRATLARQLLLARSPLSPTAAIEQLAGMQAQVPRPPFIGLWSRLATFARDDLATLARSRKVVRATMMRATIHLVTARDYLAWRPVLQPLLSTNMRGVLGDRAPDLDPAALAAAARAVLPATFATLREHLVAKFPKFDDRALGYALRMSMPLVLVPDDSRWAFPGNADFDDATRFLSAKLRAATDAALDTFVRRYLAAFGPATIKDAARWSGMREVAAAFERLRPELVTFRDESNRELFDLPDAPRPPADTPAPIRLLPDFDNLLLAHDDRTRLIDPAHKPHLVTKNLLIPATFLVDGRVAGTWTITRKKAAATLALRAFAKLPKPTRTELVAEAERALRFVEDDATSFAVTVDDAR